MEIFISILIAIYIMWSAISLAFLEIHPDEPKCFKITNCINLGILYLVVIGAIIGLFATIIYNGIF